MIIVKVVYCELRSFQKHVCSFSLVSNSSGYLKIVGPVYKVKFLCCKALNRMFLHLIKFNEPSSTKCVLFYFNNITKRIQGIRKTNNQLFTWVRGCFLLFIHGPEYVIDTKSFKYLVRKNHVLLDPLIYRSIPESPHVGRETPSFVWLPEVGMNLPNPVKSRTSVKY